MTFTKRVKTILEEKRSKIVRRTLNPSFNLVLLLELESILDVKGLKIRITVHDYDKHTKVTELGAVTISTNNCFKLWIFCEFVSFIRAQFATQNTHDIKYQPCFIACVVFASLQPYTEL